MPVPIILLVSTGGAKGVFEQHFVQISSIFKPIYDKSFFLQKIDWLIGVNILLVIFTSTAASSDFIGYFALFAMILTAVKLLTKSGEKFSVRLKKHFFFSASRPVALCTAMKSMAENGKTACCHCPFLCYLDGWAIQKRDVFL